MKVKCYWNLHKNTYSIVAMEGECKGRVIGYNDSVHLENITFKVSEAGRQRVLKERAKNVHAFVIGTMKSRPHNAADFRIGVTYNPYIRGEFYQRGDGSRVDYAGAAILGVLRHIKDGKCINRANIMAKDISAAA